MNAPPAIPARSDGRDGRDAGFRAEALTVLLAALTLVAVLLPSAMRDAIIDPDEGRTAEIAREMIERGDYLLPHLEALPYLDKPFIPFALSAVSLRVLGHSELAVRAPTMLFTALTILLTGWWARRRIGPGAGSIAAWAMASSPLVVFLARAAIPDGVLVLFTTASFIALYEAVESEEPGVRRRWSVAMWLAIGLGVLTKGPIAFLLPLIAGIPFAIWRHRISRLVSVPGLAAFVLVVAPWIAWVSQRVPDFLDYALVTETLERLTTTKLHRTGWFGYFIPLLIGGCFPWSVALAGDLVASWRARIRDFTSDHMSAYLVLWIIVPFIFFSLSQSKRPQYVLPLVPAVSTLFARAATRTDGFPGRRTTGAASIGFALFLFATVYSGLLVRRLDSPFHQPATFLAVALGTMFMIAGGATVIHGARSFRLRFAILVVPMMLVPLVASPLTASVANERSIRAIVTQIRPAIRPETRLVCVRGYWPSLSFYLQRTTIVSSWDTGELTSNYARRHYDEWIGRPGLAIRGGGWWAEQLADCREPTIFLVMHRRHEDERSRLASVLPLLGTDREIEAFGPCGPAVIARDLEPGQ